jgi:hypothetical protein
MKKVSSKAQVSAFKRRPIENIRELTKFLGDFLEVCGVR